MRTMYSSLAEQFIWLTSVEVVGEYCVRVSFTDGLSFDFDLRPWFTGTSGELLGSPEEFKKVRLDRESDTLVWNIDYTST